MEVVKKTISLEPYISRVYGGLPFVGYDPLNPPKSNWGKIVKTVDFSKFTQEDVAIYGNNIKMWGKMTYPSIMETYYALKAEETENLAEMAPTTENKINEDKNRCLIRFVEKNKLVVGNEIEDGKCGCPLPRKEEKDYTIDIIGGDAGDQRFTDPEININLLLTQTANLIGSFTILPKDWVVGKKYYDGDPVIYDSQVYVLSGEPFKAVGECTNLLEDSSLSAEVKNLFTTDAEVLYYVFNDYPSLDAFDDGYSVQGRNIPIENFIEVDSVDEIVKNGYVFAKISTGASSFNYKYFVKPFFAGYLDKRTYQLYFDEIDSDGNFVGVGDDGGTLHWRLRSTPFENSTLLNITAKGKNNGLSLLGDGVDISYDSTPVSGVIGESRLNEFTRLSKTVDDERNELPGKKIDDSGALTLPYAIGSIKNVQSNDGEDGEKYYTGDYLYAVLVNGNTITSDGDFTQYIASLGYGFEGTVEFVYYVGCNIIPNENGFSLSSDYDTKSMKYTDKYSFEIDTVEAELDETTVELLYMKIDYESGSEYVTIENLDNLMYLTKLSEINYETTGTLDNVFNKSPNFMSAPFFMEDYKLGLTYLNSNYDDFVIDRGDAAAFERHLRLSEVKTVQDLENYGNGFFELKK